MVNNPIICSPVIPRLPDVLHVVLELGLRAARPEGDDDAVVEGERDPLAVAADGQRRHAVRPARVEARVLIAHGGDHVGGPAGGGHRPRVLKRRKKANILGSTSRLGL